MTYIEKKNLIDWMCLESNKYYDISMDKENREPKERLEAWTKDRVITGLIFTMTRGENFEKILSGHSSDIEVPGGSEKKEVNDGR